MIFDEVNKQRHEHKVLIDTIKTITQDSKNLDQAFLSILNFTLDYYTDENTDINKEIIDNINTILRAHNIKSL